MWMPGKVSGNPMVGSKPWLFARWSLRYFRYIYIIYTYIICVYTVYPAIPKKGHEFHGFCESHILVGIYNKHFQAAIILNGLRLTGYMYLVDEILSR